LVETRGPLADLAARLAQSHLSGAPAAATLDAFVASMHDAERYRSVEAARIVGVKLTLPLTLLLLPGFILLTIAPFVVDQLGPLLGSAQ
jgi:pilus assembly protein TadC